ncbi:hypothetical protein HYPSUDRAFT_40603 [Hypholoma sublateritium FD-334 SS-4]|uniref:Uncharacterized protein n=1 Tax=Hypholoma sublateritium (strain FD-334 SS-4) TaxID=945553 RepID=A0A0D2P279_HYPSF|nr:hypothetical protein HYPSUDRAFT_40603 [Hypholoma sublateritium FD-334 SS-4]
MTTNSGFDYTSLLPGALESTLQTLTKVYQDNSDQLNNAYLYTVLPGVYTSAPNIVRAKDIQFQVAFRSFPSLRNFISYANLLVSLVPAVTDRDALVSILLPEASGWQQLDVSDLAALNTEYRDIFKSYLPILDPILTNLQKFLAELATVDKSNPPAWFHQTLFDTLRPILSFASFRDGVVGESSLAGILGLPISTVSTPLNKVLFPFFPTSPNPKVTIGKAVQENLIDAIQAYSGTVGSLIPLFSAFADTCATLAAEQAAIVPRIKDNSPGKQPATGDQCIVAWNGVVDAATGFINLLSGGSSTSAASTASTTSLAQKSFRVATTATASLTPGDVTAAFGPPSDASTTLPEMSATTGQIVANFNKILTLPFVDDLKVKDKNEVETSVYTVMVNCKRQYEALQGTTVEIVRDLNGYSLLQDVILPMVNTSDGLSLDEFLRTNLPLVMKYGKDAKKIATDTQALLTEFEGWLEVLNKNIDEINKSIDANKAALDEAQSAYDSAKAGAIIQGILGVAFTAVAIAALAFGQGSLAAGFGMSAGTNFAMMINDAVKAGKLSVVIGNLKNIISNSKVTRDQLGIVIPLFRNIIDLMGTIHTVWETISTSLTDVKDTYNLWNNPAFFTPESIKGALADWREVHVQSEKYISIVAGQSSSFAQAFKSTQANVRSALSTSADEPPPPYEIAVLPGYEKLLGQSLSAEERVGRFRAMAKASDINSLITALSPPSLTLGSNRSQLNDAANSYRQISSLLNGVYNDSANDATRLANTITSNLIPSLSKAIEFYIKFADGQEDPFAGGTSQAAMNGMIAERWQELNEGSNLAKAAETVFINFRNDSQGALNLLTRHVNELNQQIATKEATLRDLRADYDKWSWVIYWPIPPGIGAIIYVIIDSITQTTNELNKLRNDINKLNSTQNYVTRVQQMSVDVGRTTSALSQSWSALTTKTNDLQVIVGAVVINPVIVEAVRPVVQAQWKAFSNALKQW